MSKISLDDYEKIEKINLEQQKAIKDNAKAVVMKEIQEKNEEDSYNALLTYIENYKDKKVGLDSNRLTNFIKLHKILEKRYQAKLEYYKGLAEDNKESMEEYEEEIQDLEKEHTNELRQKNQAYNKLSHRVLKLRKKCKDRNFKIKVLYFLILLSNIITFDITYHYQISEYSYTQTLFIKFFTGLVSLCYMSYFIISGLFMGVFRAFVAN